MSYEKSPVVDNSAINQSAPAPMMREEREIDPYAHKRTTIKPPVNPEIGQLPIKSEAPRAEEPAKPEETVTLSPQVAALARNEQDLKAKAASLETERAEIAELKALKAKLAAKDFSGIEDLVKYDDYTQYLIEKSEASTPEQQALKALAAKVDGVEKAHKEDVEKRFEAAVNDRRKAVTSLVESNEEYSTIKELKMQEAVVQHILDTWENDSIDLSPEDAAKEVEAELLERAGKWASLSKLKAKTPTEDEKKQLPPLKPGIKTLTNNMAVSGEIKRPLRSFQNMSDSERYAEARRRAEEKLKQNER